MCAPEKSQQWMRAQTSHSISRRTALTASPRSTNRSRNFLSRPTIQCGPRNAVESCDMGAQPQGAARQVVVCSHTTRHCGLSHREKPHLRRIPSSSGTSTPRASRDSGNKLLSGALTRCRLGRQSCSPPSIIGILPRSPRDASEAFGVSLGLSTRCR